MNRYYSSGFGRFMTPDPYMSGATPVNPDTWNRYSYAGGDPVNRNDPGGLLWVCFGGSADGLSLDCPSAGYHYNPFTVDDWDDAHGNGQRLDNPCGTGAMFLPNPWCFVATLAAAPGPSPTKSKPRTYFLVVTKDCYDVPQKGSVTREIEYRLEYLEYGMSRPMGYAAVIWEHLTGDLPISGPTSPSSAAPGWFPGQHSVLLGNSDQYVSQTFSAIIKGVDVGLALYGFGGGWQELDIEKHTGYVSINGDIGGKIDGNGKLIPGTYRPCP